MSTLPVRFAWSKVISRGGCFDDLSDLDGIFPSVKTDINSDRRISPSSVGKYVVLGARSGPDPRHDPQPPAVATSELGSASRSATPRLCYLAATFGFPSKSISQESLFVSLSSTRIPQCRH